jgi:hypothetical protein
MNKFQSIRFKLLIVALCSLILLAAQGLFTQPALAEKAAAPSQIAFKYGSSPNCKLATVSWPNPQKAFVFAVAADGTIWTRALNGNTLTWDETWTWLAAPPVAGRTFKCVGAASWATGRIDVFATDSAGYAWHKYLDGTAWGPVGTWEALGKPRSDSYITPNTIQVVSWGPLRVDAFVLYVDGDPLYHISWDAYQGGWSSWTAVRAGNITTWGVNRFDSVGMAINADWTQSVGHKYFDGANWWPTSPENLGGNFYWDPFSISRVDGGLQKLDIFARDIATNAIFYKGWGGYGWSGWSNLGGGVSGSTTSMPITGVSPVSYRFDIFEVRSGSAQGVYHKMYLAGGWYPWEYIGGEASLGYVKASSWGPTRIDLFAIRTDGSLWHLAWNGSTWTPSIYGWEYIGS